MSWPGTFSEELDNISTVSVPTSNGTTNDRLRNGSPRVTTRLQDRLNDSLIYVIGSLRWGAIYTTSTSIENGFAHSTQSEPVSPALCFSMNPGTHCIKLTVVNVCTSVMMSVIMLERGCFFWGEVSCGRRTPLIFMDRSLTVQRCVNVILRVAVLFIRRHVTFLQNNARAHVT